MKYLGLDLGTKTLGLSISNGEIASSFKTIRYETLEELFSELDKVVEEHKIECMVLGYPKNMNNTIGPKAILTEEFQKKLQERYSILVDLQDERLSTVAAHNYMIEGDLSRKKRKQKVDSLAATIILQTYLDKKGKDL